MGLEHNDQEISIIGTAPTYKSYANSFYMNNLVLIKPEKSEIHRNTKYLDVTDDLSID